MIIKKRRKNNKGQAMSLPFTLIFSIILVAVVIFVGFYVINMFLDRTTQAEFSLLPNEIQKMITDMRFSGATAASKDVELECPEEIEFICFVDFSKPKQGIHSNKFSELETFPYRTNANFFYYPLWIAEDYESFSSWALLCGNTACVKVPDETNPLCMGVVNGKVEFTLVKESGQPYVFVRPQS